MTISATTTLIEEYYSPNSINRLPSLYRYINKSALISSLFFVSSAAPHLLQQIKELILFEFLEFRDDP